MRLFLPSGLFLVLLLSLKVGASSNVVNAIEVEGYTQVKSLDELWRFQAGSTREGLTIGTECVCLLTNRNLFLAGRGEGVYSEYKWCKRDEHWELKPVGDDKFALKRRGQEAYMSCAGNGGVILREHAKADEHFYIFIDESGEKISFYSVSHGRFVRADNRGKTYCNTDKNVDPGSIFYGWKTGDQSAWMPSERHEIVTTLDNSKSKRIKEFSFEATVGVKTVKSDKAGGVRVNQPLLLTTAVSKQFLKGYYKSEFQTEWSEQDDSIWEEAKTETISWRVYPEDKVQIIQVVGVYGPFEIYSKVFGEIPVT